MKLTLPPLAFAPGSILCLHVPRGWAGPDDMLENELRQLAGRLGKVAAISLPAGHENRQATLPPDLTSVRWLSRVTATTEDWSKRLIANLGEPVAEMLSHNAGTPRNLLGLAATLARKCDVMVYSTVALDTEGCRKVHEFVESKCRQLCAVHLSTPTVYGNGSPHPRICPPGAQCIELA